MWSPSERGGSEDTVKRRPRLLIVEDDYFTALGYEGALQEVGYDVVGMAANYDEAVRLAGTERPDLVIMDISLAGPKDGVEAAIAIKDQFALPTLFASAYVSEANRLRAEAAQPVGWISKPIEMGRFVTLVQEALERLRSGSH